jgi:hypothetical protein
MQGGVEVQYGIGQVSVGSFGLDAQARQHQATALNGFFHQQNCGSEEV